MIRIIAGKYKGKKLALSKDDSIRPTTDRFKESLFNILTSGYKQKLNNTVVLDLFAGSGSLGLEALSRGVSKVVFVDKNTKALQLVKGNLELVKLLDKAELILADSTNSDFKKLGLQFSIVFLDPPYDSTLVEEALLNLIKQDVCSKDCLYIVESNKNLQLQDKIEYLELQLERQIGKSFLCIYQLKSIN